jgi:Trm5-related predicted tRNA methylase
MILLCRRSGGRIKSREHITEEIYKAAEAFVAMLEGKNFGKAILQVANPEDIKWQSLIALHRS